MVMAASMGGGGESLSLKSLKGGLEEIQSSSSINVK